MDVSLVLASASPQRKTLLAGLGIPFTTVPSHIDERGCMERDPEKRSIMLARMKAQEVSQRMPESFVLGCDTLVVAPDGSLLEKPKDSVEARMHLQKQSGGVSTVHSAICLIAPGEQMFEGISSSGVHFKSLSDTEIDWWISTNLWNDRSGSFQIDGPGQLMIKHIEGDWTGIVGLPIFLFGELAKKAQLSVHQ